MFAAICFAACGGDENSIPGVTPDEPNTTPKEFLVSLGFSGEITSIEESPLSRAATNDLYGIQVYSSPTSSDNYKPYAYGLFDSKDGMVIKLLEGYKYKFESSMVVDGKQKISSYASSYDHPFTRSGFSTKLENKFNYDSGKEMDRLDYGSTNLGLFGYFDHPNIMRYYGEVTDYVPTANGSVSINMKKVVFGAKFITEGFTEGTLYIKLKDAPTLQLVFPQTEIEDIFTFSHNYGGSWTADTYTETILVSISWQKGDGVIEPLMNQEITFKRNIKTTITVKVNDSSVNQGLNITEEKNELQPGENIVLESSGAGNTPVNPSAN
ncbi:MULTISPECIES: hypothetical protein [Mediterranea]|uniref:hypothetical protein n=1 Tax=Mediterranea TaxID=1926659 RepID=UPI002011B15E|nr:MULTISPECIES: hypothetical protein [Mediterranea]MCL1607836.1 hypothetical protein [Mediterranea sp. ET5]MDM8122544.1 hypothetical protein [Mediterranea massiliensis]MDM8198955.1 hypothetical protein [Mediterranea massiliensis]